MNKVSYIYSPNCKPCKDIAPKWEKLVKEYEGVDNIQFEKLNGNDLPLEFKLKHDLRMTPVFLVFEGDNAVKETGHSGFANVKKRVSELING